MGGIVLTGSRTTDFNLEVAKGNFTGETPITINMTTTAATSVFGDWWNLGGLLTYPTVAETLQVRSTSPNDTDGGSGANKVQINTLSLARIEQTQDVTLNGTTPVVLTGTHFRMNPSLVIPPVGTPEGNNEGDIIIETAAGLRRQTIAATSGLSHEGFSTVPAGFSLFGVQLISCPSFNNHGEMRIGYRLPGSDQPFIYGPPIPFYQQPLVMPVKSPFGVPQQSDIRFQVRCDNSNALLTQQADIILVDNSTLQNPQANIEAR